jgi:hypothetical protein
MIEKCSIGNMSYNIQNITLIILILILIIVIIYYLKNSSTKHNELIEKYTNTDIIDDSYNTHNSLANSLIYNEFPTSGTEVTLRACQVQFNNKFDDPNDTVRYVYQDDWQEIDTIKEPGPSSTYIDVPKKIISRSNETNKDAITNYSERSKCFKKMSDTETDNKYRYQGNALINYSTGNHSKLKVGPSGVNEDYMEMNFKLGTSQEEINSYFTNLKNSICSLIYSNKLDGTTLDNLALYRLTLNANNIITAINQITINSANNHIFTISPTTSFSDLLSSSDRNTSYVYSDSKFIFQSNSTLSVDSNYINIKIYNFNRELLCSHIQKNIKSYTIIDNKQIDVNRIVDISAGNVSVTIDNTNFPGAASSYATKDALKQAIENKIIAEIATANADAISNETAANTNITTYTRERDTFLTSINTRDKFLDKIFDNTIAVSRRNFLVSTSGLINGLKLNMLGYKVEDISSDETILNSSEEPSFQKIINNTPANIHTVEIYTDTSRPYTKTFDTKTDCEILIVGGGGGGGGGIGGGGGAGAVVHLPDIQLPAGTYTINVGNGGAGRHRTNVSDNGSQSSIVNSNNTIRIIAEGGGGTTGGHALGIGSVGGSGGGAAGPNQNINTGGDKGKSSSLGGFVGKIYGNPGGSNTAFRAGGVTNAAGGGGAGAAAANIAPSSGVPGNGGDGRSFNITGRNIFYGGGGGGGGHPTFGIGGKGGGGNGTSYTNYGNGGNGQANTGGGGGGGAWSETVGGNGGSGVVIIRYKNVPQQDGDDKKITLKYDNDNLFAWYNFDNNYNDVSGNGNNLTNHGTSIITAQKIDGKAIEFDNTDYLEFPATMNPYTIWNGNGITFSFWVRFTAHGNWARLIDIQSGAYVYNGMLISANSTHGAIGSGNELSFFCNGKIFWYNNDNLVTSLGNWHHIVWSIDKNGRWDIYLNNVRINNAEVAPVPNIPYNLRYINKSVYHWDGQWKGQMDDFRIYKTSLSASEVEQLYNKTRTLPSNIYRATLPIQTNVELNGETKTLDAGIYNITMGPLNTVIKKHNTDIEIGTYTHTDGNKFIFKYSTSRSLQQLHNLETSFSGTAARVVEDRKYLLGDKTLDMTTKYEVYIYHRRDITHSITLYADTTLLTNGTDYITSTVDEEVVSNKIYLLTYTITIKENIEGNIYLKSDMPIFYIDETNRGIFNDTTDTQFSNNVNNFTTSGSATLTSLNNMFDISTANAAKATAVGKKITYNIDTTPGIQSPLSIKKNSSTISLTDENSLNNLKTTYNNIHNYNESSGGTMTPIINTNTFGSILDPVATNIEEYISYEFPSAPSEDKLTPSSRTTAFDIKSNATKYIYFKKI